MEKVEELLGRKLNNSEKVIYEMQKNKENYVFQKDGYGNLISVKKEDVEIIYYCKQGDPYCISPRCTCNTVRPII